MHRNPNPTNDYQLLLYNRMYFYINNSVKLLNEKYIRSKYTAELHLIYVNFRFNNNVW